MPVIITSCISVYISYCHIKHDMKVQGRYVEEPYWGLNSVLLEENANCKVQYLRAWVIGNILMQIINERRAISNTYVFIKVVYLIYMKALRSGAVISVWSVNETPE